MGSSIDDSEEKYISLTKATRYCDYSQEYLSLRARQGKLKAIKFGRNWVTKKEWVEEYVKEYKNKNYENVAPLPAEPIEAKLPRVRFSFLMALAIVLLTAGVAFGQNGIMETIPRIKSFSDNLSSQVYSYYKTNLEDIPLETLSDIRKFSDNLSSQAYLSYTYIIGAIERGADGLFAGHQTETAALSSNGLISAISEDLKNFSRWLSRQPPALSDFLREKFSSATNLTRNGFVTFVDFVREKFSSMTNLTMNGFLSLKRGLITLLKPRTIGLRKSPPKSLLPQPANVPPKKKVAEEKKPKEIEVSRIIKIQPVKEITRKTIVTKIDDAELAKIKARLADISVWGTDIENLRKITKKLQATPSYTQAPSSPIYIGSQGIQVGGTGNFQSLGVTGSAGVGNLGVGNSATIGSDSSDQLTVNATSYFKALSSFGSNAELTIDSSGNLSTTGNLSTSGTLSASTSTISVLTTTGGLTVGGDLSVSGSQAYYGPSVITTSTIPQLSIRYDSSNKLDLSVSSTGSVILDASSGEIQAASGNAFYTSGGNPIRQPGEELFRMAVPIYRFGMPAQTASTTFVRISKYFSQTSDISLPSTLPGTTRVYRLAISYADDISTTSASSWRIYQPLSSTATSSFSLPGQAASTFEEGKPYLTGVINIPNTDWEVEVKVPAGKTIRIFQIYLVAYDRMD